MQLTFNSLPIWLASEPIDFRKAIDGLCALIVDQLSCQPNHGIFIFYNSTPNRLKIIMWHINGFMMIYKRFEKNKLTIKKDYNGMVSLSSEQLTWLLMGVDWITLSGNESCEIKEYS
jgi:transposase